MCKIKKKKSFIYRDADECLMFIHTRCVMLYLLFILISVTVVISRNRETNLKQKNEMKTHVDDTNLQ